MPAAIVGQIIVKTVLQMVGAIILGHTSYKIKAIGTSRKSGTVKQFLSFEYIKKDRN